MARIHTTKVYFFQARLMLSLLIGNTNEDGMRSLRDLDSILLQYAA